MENKNTCCKTADNTNKKGMLKGIVYGILPHSFCIAFVVFSVIGATAVGAIFKNILLIPYFFEFLIIISFVFATISVIFYLKSTSCLCLSGIKNKWKYITILYSVTILVNLSMFFVVFPALANVDYNKNITGQQNQLTSKLSLAVEIPCSGHSFLIIDELKKIDGVVDVRFKMPNIFDISYNDKITSVEKITSLEVFKTYKATIKE
jgi:hypothetical protein